MYVHTYIRRQPSSNHVTVAPLPVSLQSLSLSTMCPPSHVPSFLLSCRLEADHKEYVRHQLKKKKEYQEALAEQVLTSSIRPMVFAFYVNIHMYVCGRVFVCICVCTGHRE